MSTGKRILAVCGSPRRQGNSETITDEILKAAADIHCEKIIISEMNIHPCKACDLCKESNPVCIIKDAMTSISKKMKDSEVWILATPVYWWGPSAQMKTFIDRWYGLDPVLFKNKKVVLVVSLGDTDTATARHTIGMLTDSLAYREAAIIETIIATDLNDKKDIQKHPEYLERARAIGMRLSQAAVHS